MGSSSTIVRRGGPPEIVMSPWRTSLSWQYVFIIIIYFGVVLSHFFCNRLGTRPQLSLDFELELSGCA